MADQPLVLGSASPRRAALLAELAVSFRVASVDIDERSFLVQADPGASVRAIALAKFHALVELAEDPTGMALTADTLVVCGGEAMGKPDSEHELTSMLNQMSARTISIVTGLCVGMLGSEPLVETVTTHVGLRELAPSEIEQYVQTGVGADKAGGLALQAEAGAFIEWVEGCWSNVLGLPICAVAAALELAPGGRREQRCSVDLCGRHG